MAKLPEIYPWQTELWAYTVETLERLPHALLVTGQEGSGKFQFASRLAAILLCESTDSSPCGACRNCHFFSASTHPDLHVVTSEAKLKFMDAVMISYADRYLDDERSRAKRKFPRTSIVIDQIRTLIQASSSNPHLSENKVFLIDPADSMTIAGANSLLKILEEPPSNTYLILIAENPQNLLPTITSRCQQLVQSDPSKEVVRKWLSDQNIEPKQIDTILNSGKGPVVGLKLAESDSLIHSAKFIDDVIQHLIDEKQGDTLKLVESGVHLGESECLYELHMLVGKLIKSKFSNDRSSESGEATLNAFSRRTNVSELFSVYDHIGYLRNQLRVGGMDKTLTVEDALLAIESAVNGI